MISRARIERDYNFFIIILLLYYNVGTEYLPLGTEYLPLGTEYLPLGTEYLPSEVILLSCYSPLPAIRKRDSEQFHVGKRGQFFVPYTDFKTGELIEPQEIPCGKCIGCRLDYSRTWADRCVLESLLYDSSLNWFVTLTYSDEDIQAHENEMISSVGTLTLYPKHVQDFLKRVREHWSRVHGHEGIRFFMCGEYGTTTARPHYHILFYNLPLYDLKLYSKNEMGNYLFNSAELEELWSHGFVVIGDLTWETCAYTARYVLKKYKGMNKDDTKQYYSDLGLYPEFTRMSRKPGIGRQFYEDHKTDIYKFDEIILPRGRKSKPSRYFDSLMKEDDPVCLTFIKECRKHVAELQKIEKFALTTLDEDAYFRLQEDQKKNSVKALTRLL